MAILLTNSALRAMFPDAPEAVIQAFLSRQDLLAKVGVSNTRTRLAFFFANLGHETGGFTIKNLTENINYTAQRAAEIWPSRFSSAADVRNQFGTAQGWQKKLFDNVYGNRMGNRPGTDDGSRFIGRGGPQITGRDGYRVVGSLSGLPLEDQPELATKAEHQPAIACAFWDWKKLNELADANDFRGVVRRWNGGLIGIDDREARLAKCKAALASLVAGEPPSPPKGGAGPVIGGGSAGTLVGGTLAWLGIEPWIAVMVGITVVAIVGVAIVVLMKKDGQP